MSALGLRLSFLKKARVPSAFTHPCSSAQSSARMVNTLGDLRVTLGLFLLGQSPRSSGSSSALCAVEPGDGAGLFHGGPSVSFGTPDEDQMSIAALKSGLLSSEEKDEAELPPSGVIAHAESDSELTAMLALVAVGFGLQWNSPPCPEHSRVDDCLPPRNPPTASSFTP